MFCVVGTLSSTTCTCMRKTCMWTRRVCSRRYYLVRDIKGSVQGILIHVTKFSEFDHRIKSHRWMTSTLTVRAKLRETSYCSQYVNSPPTRQRHAKVTKMKTKWSRAMRGRWRCLDEEEARITPIYWLRKLRNSMVTFVILSDKAEYATFSS